MRWLWGLIFFFLTLQPALAAHEKIQQAAHCIQAVKQVSTQKDIPFGILMGIALTETGRSIGKQRMPWPWAVNADGKGWWFASKQQAITHVRKLQKRGINSIDVGCMQINLRWHKQAFDSLEEAFDPTANINYAADFLHSLKRGDKKWMQVAGHYHSKTPHRAERYRKKISQYRKYAYTHYLSQQWEDTYGAVMANLQTTPKVKYSQVLPFLPVGSGYREGLYLSWKLAFSGSDSQMSENLTYPISYSRITKKPLHHKQPNQQIPTQIASNSLFVADRRAAFIIGVSNQK